MPEHLGENVTRKTSSPATQEGLLRGKGAGRCGHKWTTMTADISPGT
jgi:hypothetical protein